MKFYVNEKKGIVCATYDNAHDVFSRLRDFASSLNTNFTYVNGYIVSVAIANKYSDRFNMVGIAKCHPSDKFDIEKGKKIAAARLQSQMETLKYDMLLYLYKQAKECYAASINKMHNRIIEHNNIRQRLRKKIEALNNG